MSIFWKKIVFQLFFFLRSRYTLTKISSMGMFSVGFQLFDMKVILYGKSGLKNSL